MGEGKPASGFWNEAILILSRGSMEMRNSISDKRQLVAAYDRMDKGLGRAVERYKPAPEELGLLRESMASALKLMVPAMMAHGIDPGRYFEKEEAEVASAILDAIGTDVDMMSAQERVSKAVRALAKGGFTEMMARSFIGVLAMGGSTSLEDMVANLEYLPVDLRFLRFLRDFGVPEARGLAIAALRGVRTASGVKPVE